MTNITLYSRPAISEKIETVNDWPRMASAFRGSHRDRRPRLATLLDAGEYIAALPKKEHAAPKWQAAMEA
ncbi:hypothetical protein JQ582_42020 [Bradyrhizobium japonicum]|uniref:hypothetical protein n=1 Tax=Bradyrhizobium japonicum TaxID=375 RepID=UPI001BA9DC3F|nr:hypothetical protein [Bradyrhizobium japonicum]MBR0734526.1 hypothetical protein [Bradyrhizobium japonicum]MBR0750476.1 hypothetical protein [Bradyrhizobium japonicum]